MAYTPNEWGVGNLITASKMNKIERQLVVNTSDLDDIRNGVTVPTYEEFETLRNDVATEYDAIKTYAVGDYVIYNTQLYKCKTAITSAETWTAVHWDAVEVGEELQRIEGKNEEEVAELKSALNDTLFLKGQGNTYIEDEYADVSANSNYRIYPLSWDVSGVTSSDSSIKFYIGYKNNGTTTNVKTVYMNGTIQEYYDVQIPESAINPAIIIGGRVTASKQGIVRISNIDYQLEQLEIQTKMENDIDSLQEDLNRIKQFKLPYGDIISGSYVDHDGTIVSYLTWSRTDYVDVSKLALIIPQSTPESSYNAFFDDEKVFISSFSSRTAETPVDVPSNAKYAMFSNTNAGMTTLSIGYAEKIDNQAELIKNTFASVYCDTDISSKLLEYGEIIANSGESDTFLFFTDPHPFSGAVVGRNDWLNGIMARMPLVEKAFNSTSADFCLCGGDWLNANDTPQQAIAKLGYAYGTMKHMFSKYYMMCGNHDTNYQGTEQLSDNALINTMFSGIGKTYYDFKTYASRWYVFDTGIDWYHQMTQFRWNQIDWFANNLIANDDEHSVIALHIVTNQYQEDFESDPTFHGFTQKITELAQAYNAKTTITLNSTTYDFTNTTGIVEFAIAGHSHFDALTTLNDIPIMITDWVRDGDSATFDLVLADYTNHVVKTVRIGIGSNRTMNMASAS